MPRLNLDRAVECRRRHAAGESARSLAREFDVSVSTMRDLLRGDSHKPRILVRLTPRLLAALAKQGRERNQTLEQAALSALEQLVA